jgi:hypothetical protein
MEASNFGRRHVAHLSSSERRKDVSLPHLRISGRSRLLPSKSNLGEIRFAEFADGPLRACLALALERIGTRTNRTQVLTRHRAGLIDGNGPEAA